jgi:hypothetical protein
MNPQRAQNYREERNARPIDNAPTTLGKDE